MAILRRLCLWSCYSITVTAPLSVLCLSFMLRKYELYFLWCWKELPRQCYFVVALSSSSSACCVLSRYVMCTVWSHYIACFHLRHSHAKCVVIMDVTSVCVSVCVSVWSCILSKTELKAVSCVIRELHYFYYFVLLTVKVHLVILPEISCNLHIPLFLVTDTICI